VTLAVIGREIGWKWAAFSVGFNTVLAYAVSVTIYQVGMTI
jgi:ferrous iron transport protein B